MAHIHSVYDSDTHFTINPITRVITNTTAKAKLVQFDHNSERFTFEMPRFVEEHDMTLCDKVEVHYINVSSNKNEQSADVYLVDDVQVSPADDSIAIFSWLISANATKYAGTLNFLIRFVCLDGEVIEYAWNTAIFSGITVANGMNNGEAILEDNIDVLEAWKRELYAEFKVNYDEEVAKLEALKAKMLSEIEAAADIVQTTGESETAVMSQKATSLLAEYAKEDAYVARLREARRYSTHTYKNLTPIHSAAKEWNTASFPRYAGTIRMKVVENSPYKYAFCYNDTHQSFGAWNTTNTYRVFADKTYGLRIQRVDGADIAESEADAIRASVSIIFDINPIKLGYVSPTGSDDSIGTEAFPYATVSKAIAEGCDTIMLYGGIYEQTITLPSFGTVRIAPVEVTNIPIFVDPNRLKIESAEVHDGNVYVADASFGLLADTPMIFQDGVPDATTMIADEERMPQQRGKEYRCDDTMITKCTATVLEDAVTEMQEAEAYKFFYDAANSKIYFTAPNADFTTYPIVCSSNGSLFSGNARTVTLHVSGIECKYMRFDISKTVDSVITNCKCSGAYASALGQFLYDDAINPRFVNCEACMSHGKSNGDGFNSHCTNGGDTFAHESGAVLENCWSHDNADDGWSDHYRSETMIIGGLYEYNGKGGITPAYGTHCICQGVYSRYNYNGFNYVAAANDGGQGGQIACYNCVAENNTRGNGQWNAGFIVSGSNNTMILVNCKSIGNKNGYVCVADNRAKLIDCGSSGDTYVRHTAGTFEIINTTAVS